MMIVNSSTSQPASQSLADQVRAAHHMHLLAAGSLGPVDRLSEAPHEDEVAARRLLCGAGG